MSKAANRAKRTDWRGTIFLVAGGSKAIKIELERADL
jgi:hypothetical protein